MASPVEVRAIELPRDAMAFCKSWWPIYADDPMWVPPLLMDRKAFFDPKRNPYFDHARVQCFMAYRDGKPVGTISASVDDLYLKHDAEAGFFGFFEFIDDEAVARALLDSAIAWLKSRGMKKMIGPANFSTNHEFALLVDGFDTPPRIANPHNRPYYGPMYEKLGLVGVKDWYAYWLEATETPSVIARISERFLKRHPEVTLRPIDISDWDEEVKRGWEIYEDAWEHNWGHVEFTHEEYEFASKNLKSILDPGLCWVAEVNGEAAAFSITLPDYNMVAKKMNGRLFPFGWYHFLVGRRNIDVLRILILGVKQKFQHLPLGAPLYVKTWERGLEMGVRGAEASLVLEDNHRMRGAMEKLGGRIYKTYRSYELVFG